MSTPQITAPPIPQTLELDTHTRQFFDPSEWSGPVTARFKLDQPALGGMIFIGRMARFCTGALHLVVQAFTDKAEVDGRGACFISSLALPLTAENLEERDLRTRQFFARYLSYPETYEEENGRSGVPTLRGAVARSGLRRLHFDARTGLGFGFHATGCSIVDARDERGTIRAIRPSIDLGDALFDFESPKNPGRAFIEMDGGRFHARVAELLRDETCALSHSVRFHRMDLFERCRHVSVREGKSLRGALDLAKLALTIEMGAGGTLCDWESAEWHPWGEGELIEGLDADGNRVSSEVPHSLERWMALIGEKTGCRVRDEIRQGDEGLHGFAKKWAGQFIVWAGKPSAHETIEAIVRLREMMEAESSDSE